MEHTEDERAVIYLALSNQVLLCKDSLEDGELNPEQEGTVTYLLDASMKLLEKYAEALGKEEPKEIPRPSWDELTM